MTDNEATRTTFARTRPAVHEAEDEAGCYEAEVEAENFGSEAILWPRGLNIPADTINWPWQILFLTSRISGPSPGSLEL